MRIRAVLLAILALAVAGCSGWASEQPLIPPGERDLVGLSGTYQSASHGVQVMPDGNAIYIMQEADPDSDQGENAEGPFEVAFDLLRSYSPYDNVRAQAYPPMLVTAGLNDPRVTYWEPAKWVAKLREVKTDDNLLLMKTNMGAGHGGQSGRWNSLKETAEEFAFILWQMGMAPKPEAK